MENGRVVVERLVMINNSLTRSLELAEKELSRRDRDTDYKETYVSSELNLLHEVLKLEDLIRRFVNDDYY